MAVAVLFTASCAKEDISSSIVGGGEANVTFTVDLPELGTRANNYGGGSKVNILHYNVYEYGTENRLDLLSGSKEAEVTGQSLYTITIPMLKGMKYDIVFWAENKECDYYTLTGKEITVNYDNAIANDETRDAFFGSVKKFDPTNPGNMTSVELRRPFAQLNAITTDCQLIKKSGITAMHKSALKVTSKLHNQFNIFSGEATGEVENVGFAINDIPAETKTIDDNTDMHLAMNYLLVNGEKALVDVKLLFVGKRGDAEYRFPVAQYSGIPVKRNYRTNIIGKLLTASTEFEVKILPGFDGEVDKFVSVANVDELTAALASNNNVEVSLTEDIDLSDILVIGGAQSTISTSSTRTVATRNVVIDGKGKTINSTATRAINISGDVNVTIKNLTINASGERAINIIQNAKSVTLEKVIATAANYTVNVAGSAPGAKVAIKNSTLNGLCTVNVAGAGANVTVDGCTVNCNDNNTTAGESYAALCLNKDAVGGSIIATNTTVNVPEDSDSTKGRNGAENGTVTIDGSTEGVAVMVAAITYPGSDYYYSFTTLEDAIEFAKAGETVQLLRDITLSEILVINKAITLDGKGKTLTSTAARAINVSGADGVTIKNLTINASGERAINIIQNATNVTIEKVTATSANYTVNVASSAPEAVVAIKNSTLNGLCTVNVSAAGAEVTVNGCTVNCNDNNATAGEAYAALSLNKEAVGGSIEATNTTVNVTEGSDSMKGRNGAANGTVTINGSTDDVVVMVAAITYPNNNNYHAFATLQAAIEFNVKAGGNIELLRPIEIAEGKELVIDLKGQTVTATEYAFENSGTLTIKGGGVVYGTIYNEKGTMTIDGGTTYNAAEGQAYVFLNNGGTLTINTATINSGSSYPVYSYSSNDVGTKAKLVINDATVNATFGCINSYGLGNTVEINGGTYQMTGVQGKTSHIAYFSGVNAVINGGTFRKIGDINMSSTGGGGICVINGANLTIIDGNFAGDYADVYDWGGKNANGNGNKVEIAGGTYKFKPNANWIAEGKSATQNADGIWTVQ